MITKRQITYFTIRFTVIYNNFGLLSIYIQFPEKRNRNHHSSLCVQRVLHIIHYTYARRELVSNPNKQLPSPTQEQKGVK
jgi:hypothetical protein